ncbi:MAG: hypothetical protein GC150_04050 [Rhizobiales bacterium]|nr:hypothetical protein [Hyphomicrobiales bacterium]
MPRPVSRLTLTAAIVYALSLSSGGTASIAATQEEEIELPAELVEMLAAEKAARKACKIDICTIIYHPARAGDDIACEVVKTMPKPHLDRIIKASQISWPWGHASCKTNLAFSRAALADALTKPNYEFQLGAHTVTCSVLRDEGEPYEIKVTVDPLVTFENGRAKKAEIRFGDIEAPAVAKSVIWPAAKLDNTFGVFSGQVVDIVNSFIEKKCEEVKDEIPAQ